MNAETRRNVGDLLADQLESIEADLTARAEPYRYAAELCEQRDSARRFAVDYEQTAYEMTRRVNLAQSYVADMPCNCPQPPFDKLVEQACAKHDLARILSGDE